MKKQNNFLIVFGRRILMLICLISLIGFISCSSSGKGTKTGTRVIKDAAGREVHLPDTVRSVVGLSSGALRLLCYMDVADKIGYIEENEKRRLTPYMIANPGLKERPVIGTGNNFDPELLAAARIDLIISTYMSGEEADKLQKTTRKQVLVIKYGNLDDEIDDLFNSIRLLGLVFDRQERADSLVQYIKTTIDDCKSRSTGNKRPDISAYIGGIAYFGSHGLTSTIPSYPPFNILSVQNAAKSLSEIKVLSGESQHNTAVDMEQLIKWNPDYLFLDASGILIWKEEINKPVVEKTLMAVHDSKVFTVLPFNWYAVNYENLLCNTWFIGKTIYPETFRAISVEQKCREIYRFFLGTDIYDEITDLYHPFINYHLNAGIND